MLDMAEKQMINIEQLLDMLPHRYPFLLVDRIIDIEGGDQKAVGLKNVTMNENFFQGHFPNNPIMPGVLIVEAMAQTAGAIVLNNLKLSAKNSKVYFMAIDEVKFKKPVVPGDQLLMHVEKIKQIKNIWRYKGVAKVNGEICAEAIMTAMHAVEE